MEEKHRFWVSQTVGQYRYDETNGAAAEKIRQNTHYIWGITFTPNYINQQLSEQYAPHMKADELTIYPCFLLELS